MPFTTLAKPIGSRCNFDCSYCYYLEKANLYNKNEPRMTDDLLELYIQQVIHSTDMSEVDFAWHGGEPLLAERSFFEKVVSLQEKYRGTKEIFNSIQTNGSLINKNWCDFFRDNNFIVGLSLDGPKDIHDAFRRDKCGATTFERVVRAAEMLASRNVEFNILSTINAKSEGRGRDVYKFLKNLCPFLQFIPVVEYTIQTPDGPRIVPPRTANATRAPWSVSSEAFGDFMCDIFDEWVVKDVGSTFVQLFDVALAQWCGLPPPLCSFRETCGAAWVVEHNGDVYVCDHYVFPEFKLGNIKETTLGEIENLPSVEKFKNAKRDDLPNQCKKCDYLFACRGACPKYRVDKTADGEEGLSVLCSGYHKFFSHVAPAMRYMSTLLKNKQPASLVMPWARKNYDIKNS